MPAKKESDGERRARLAAERFGRGELASLCAVASGETPISPWVPSHGRVTRLGRMLAAIADAFAKGYRAGVKDGAKTKTKTNGKTKN